jgi:signal transduction histidine kinase
VRFRDTGKGIHRDDLEKIFQPFFTKKAKGTGLGLALVKKVIDMHRGEVKAISPEGGGVEFLLLLPQGKTTTSG